MSVPFTILDGVEAVEVPVVRSGGGVSLAPEQLERSLGWSLKDEGLCRGDVCVPVRDRESLIDEGVIDLASFAGILGRPLVVDAEESVAALGTPARERSEAMHGLEAPEFTLPDLDGKLHSLSDHHGSKVLLIAYASW
ncbi:MAG: hypothetical protein E4H03_03570 [Myxococcales bacterium]|jgi:hypothetical protein|nr:MAG: hypothetical protein E4H03_03570 [Myxococcales bacterium]